MHRTTLLSVIFTVAVLAVAAVTIGLLYRTALSQAAARLEEVARSQARTIEAIARHEARYCHLVPAESGHGDALDATLAQLRDANTRFSGFGGTGEFVLGSRQGDSIVFLLRQRNPDSGRTAVIPVKGVKAEPMRRALSGASGTVIGPDYSGIRVLAAYEPVGAFGMGVVAKIDLAEVQAPFVRAAVVSLLVAALVVFLGTLLFTWITNPVISRLRSSESRFHGLYSSMSEGVAMLQVVSDSSGQPTDYRLLAANPAFERLTGLKRTQAVGCLTSELFPGGSPRNREALARVSRTGEPTEFETEELSDGRAFHVSAFSPGQGMIAAVFTDVTERTRAETALRESEEKFRALAQATPDHVMLLDAELRIRYANFASPGLTVEQLVGRPLPDFAPPAAKRRFAPCSKACSIPERQQPMRPTTNPRSAPRSTTNPAPHVLAPTGSSSSPATSPGTNWPRGGCVRPWTSSGDPTPTSSSSPTSLLTTSRSHCG